MLRIAFETRGAKLEGNTLSGVAHVFGQRALVRGQYETFSAQAFDKTLKSPTTDVRAFVNHDPNMLLGRQSAGTLRLSREDDGLHFSVDLPETSYAHDLKTLITRGDIDGASFGFMPGKAEMSKAADGTPIRTHTEVSELVDVSPVALPAFEGTSLQLHSRGDEHESNSSRLARVRFRNLKR